MPYIDPCSVPTESANLTALALAEESEDGRADIPNFEDDVLPILQSSADGKVYKCTVCHAKYNDIAAVKGAKNFDPILASVRGGSMPLGETSDEMAAEDVELLERWAEANFPADAEEASAVAEQAEETEQDPVVRSFAEPSNPRDPTSAPEQGSGLSAPTGCQPQSYQ